MTPFPRGKHGHLSLYIPRASGGVTQRSTGSSDKRMVRQMEAAVQWLASVGAHDILDAFCAKQIGWGDLLALHASGRGSLAPMRARLSDLDLRDVVPAFVAAWLADGRAPRTLENYRRELTAYLDTHPMRSQWLATNVQAHLRGLAISSGSRRKHLYAFRSFERFLIESGRLSAGVLHAIRTPKKNPPRLRYESPAIDQRIVDAMAAHYRPAVALIHATGADVSSVLAMRGRDLDTGRGVCHIPGTKTAKRFRHDIPIEPWALPYLAPLRTVLPDALLFPDLTRHALAFQHKRATAAVKVSGYTLRDARHTIAVLDRRRGKSFEAIAARLGNSVYQVATVYAAFTPDDTAKELARATDSTTSDRTAALTLSRRKA